MSHVTNVSGLPEPIVRAVENDPYSRGDADYSVSDLNAPPRQVVERRRHEDEIVEDAASRIWSLVGQVGHGILERAGQGTGMVERRLFWTHPSGVRISGATDHLAVLPDGTLTDWKFTSVFTVMDGGRADWIAQLNLYAHLWRMHDHTVTRLQVVAILRDWRPGEAKRKAGYPPQQVAVLSLPLWAPEDTTAYLDERIALHEAARHGATLPRCTDEERWKRPTQWAVMKDGGKRAVKLCATDAEAHAIIGEAPKMYVEKRPGLAVRCIQYCVARPWCEAANQFEPGELGEATDDAAA